MNKNEIIDNLLKRLQQQRAELTTAIAEMSHNEPSWADRRMTLNCEILNIDSQIVMILTNLELTT